MGTLDFEWEVITDLGERRLRRNSCVWVTCTKERNRSLYNKLNISADLVDKLCWTAGTRVNLLRSKGGNLFALRPSKTGLIELKEQQKTLYVQRWQVVANLNCDMNGTEFDAWVDGEDLVFKPKNPVAN